MPFSDLTPDEVRAWLGDWVVIPEARKPEKPLPKPPQKSQMVIRTATAEDYAKRNFNNIGTFYRAKDMKS